MILKVAPLHAPQFGSFSFQKPATCALLSGFRTETIEEAHDETSEVAWCFHYAHPIAGAEGRRAPLPEIFPIPNAIRLARHLPGLMHHDQSPLRGTAPELPPAALLGGNEA